MPKTFTAQSIGSISNVRFEVDANSNITKLLVSCEVNYGTMGLHEEIDILPQLTADQKVIAQQLYNAIKSAVSTAILG